MLVCPVEGQIGPETPAADRELEVPLLVERGAAGARETHGRGDASGPCRGGPKGDREGTTDDDDPQGSTHPACT